MRLLVCLVKEAERPFFSCQDMEEIIIAVSEHEISVELVKCIGEELMRLGCIDSAGKIKDLYQ